MISMRKTLLFAITLPIAVGILTGTVLAGDKYFAQRAVYKDLSGKSIELAVGQEVGLSDKKSTRDGAIGLLVKSDDLIKGTHKLMRGTDALTVYMTSSTMDLDQFVGRGVQIWGETFQRKGIGWFMDAVKLKLLK